MPRSDAETALGGLLLGMSIPTLLFGAALVCGLSEAMGMMSGMVAVVFGSLIVLGAVMQGLSGTSLLWWHRIPPANVRPKPVARVSAPKVVLPVRRPAPPRVRARARHAVRSSSVTVLKARANIVPLQRRR